MDIKLDLDPEEINKYIAKQILDSVLGEEIEKVIVSKVAELGAYSSAIKKTIENQILIFITQMIREEYKDIIKEKMIECTTDEVIEELTGKAFGKLSQNY